MIEQAGGFAFFALLAVGAAVIAAYFIFEAWALLNDRKPITGYVREGIKAHPHWSALALLLIGVLLGHFWR